MHLFNHNEDSSCKKYCPYMTILIGIVGIVAWFYLDAEMIKTLWIGVSGLVVLMGILCMLKCRG